MGSDDRAVVDTQLRVLGVDGLRVIDASVMPRVVSSNTNAASIMIGERGAAMVLESRSLSSQPDPARSSNTNAAAIMIGERGAAMVLESRSLSSQPDPARQ